MNNSNILIYTFSTFPYINELKKVFKNIIVLKKVKMDLFELTKNLKKYPKIQIIWIAISKSNSKMESICINQFNKNWKVIKEAEYYKFDLDKLDINLKVNTKPTTYFCNYSMFYIKHFIENNNIDTKVSFLHINKQDIPLLLEYISKL